MKGDKNSTVIGQFSGKCCDYQVENNNQMTLPRELFENLFESEEYKRSIHNRHYIGFLGHPEDPGCQDYKDACIIMTESHLEENGDVYGTFDLIDTPVGRVVKSFIDAGVNFGISIRGAGDIDGGGLVDPDTFIFRGYDLVTFPAYNDAIPTFQEIAASEDLEKQVKFKKVCAAIDTNLKDITSAETLKEIKAQFNETSEQYKKVQAREEELANDDVDDVDDVEQVEEIAEENVAITAQQVEGMTQLYLEQLFANSKLHDRCRKLELELSQTKKDCKRKIESFTRISKSQTADVQKELDDIRVSNKKLVTANSKLKSELTEVKNLNLKYRHKIEASSETICQKDSTISDLKTELSKTVTASQGVERRASNLDEKVEKLKAQVEAAGQIIFEYQQAYANMYANALGVHLNNIPVTSTTSVDELKKHILGSTSSCNIPMKPSVEEIDILDEEIDEEDIVTV